MASGALVVFWEMRFSHTTFVGLAIGAKSTIFVQNLVPKQDEIQIRTTFLFLYPGPPCPDTAAGPF